MYSQSFFNAGRDISPPENYDGTAFSEIPNQSEAKPQKIESVKNEIKFSPKSDELDCECAHCNEKYAPNLASGKADQVVKMLRDQNL